MKVIVGLGNPGQQYQNTRHNVGFMAVEYLASVLAKESSVPQWSSLAKTESEVIKTPEFIFIKPQTFMNDSGRAVRKVLSFYKQSNLHQVYVIHDDLDIQLGKYKMQLGTGPKVHNGLLSLYQELGSQDFWHIRMGVDSRGGDRTLSGREYVLQQFSSADQQLLKPLFTEVATSLLVTSRG
ncbi:MAG: aminoacyl-tRNA hydrolase [bacterium]|nr:aminoacyl-tRNA hydrolase [bacterium]